MADMHMNYFDLYIYISFCILILILIKVLINNKIQIKYIYIYIIVMNNYISNGCGSVTFIQRNVYVYKLTVVSACHLI